MTIYAHIKPIIEKENIKESPLYRTLEIYMQRLGYLVAFHEDLNWITDLDIIALGGENELKELKKVAAKNDGTLLFLATLTKKTVYQHVICHPNDSGIYLPFHFDNPFIINSEGKKLIFGSAPKLLEELKWLEISLKTKGDDDLLAYWEQFQSAASLAIEHTSPFILQNEA